MSKPCAAEPMQTNQMDVEPRPANPPTTNPSDSGPGEFEGPVIGGPGEGSGLPPVVVADNFVPGVPGGPGLTDRIGPGITLQRILVAITNEFEEEELQVTFDDNSTDNQWGFHAGSGSTHVTELFRTPGAGGLLVEIVGVPPPYSPEVQWRLTVRENQGIPDRFPKFLPATTGTTDPELHTVFTMEVNEDERAAFGFTTTQGQKYYLVPTMEDEFYHIETRDTDEPEHVFVPVDLVNNANFSSIDTTTTTIATEITTTTIATETPTPLLV